MEKQGAEFHARVREGFLTEAARRKDIVVINAAQPIEKVQADIREAVMRRGEGEGSEMIFLVPRLRLGTHFREAPPRRNKYFLEDSLQPMACHLRGMRSAETRSCTLAWTCHRDLFQPTHHPHHHAPIRHSRTRSSPRPALRFHAGSRRVAENLGIARTAGNRPGTARKNPARPSACLSQLRRPRLRRPRRGETMGQGKLSADRTDERIDDRRSCREIYCTAKWIFVAESDACDQWKFSFIAST